MIATLNQSSHAPQLQITTHHTPSGVTLRLLGEIDCATADKFYDAAHHAIQLLSPPALTVDFQGVQFCDSSGLNALIKIYKDIQASLGTLTLTRVPQRCLRVLATTGLAPYFDIRESPCDP